MGALTCGLGLKPEHFAQALSRCEPGLWFEVHAENYMVEGGPRLAWLQAIGERQALSLHGVSLSLGGDEEPDREHLRRLAALVRRVEPALVSEHLAWSRWEGHYLPDLLPIQRTGRTLARIASHVHAAQEAVGRPIGIENPSHYLHLDGHEWDEIEFLKELSTRTGCTLVLDVNNVFVSASNLGFDAGAWIDRFPAAEVSQLHLAGHSTDPRKGGSLLIDSHDAPVAAPVWALFERFVRRAGPKPTLIERDGNLPAFDVLMEERGRAEGLLGREAASLEPLA